MTCRSFQYSNHAVAQMFRRGLSADAVESAVLNGEIIKDYPNDKPYPSCLMLYFTRNRPIHVVVSSDTATEICYIITAYEPDPLSWDTDFKHKI